VKALKVIIVLIAFLYSVSCRKNSDEEIKNFNVEQYIELLKSGKYDSVNLPAFDSRDIPALLEYRNETQLITNFPRNGISSFYQGDCSLGMYALWTVESIRAVAINSDYLIGRFPSQNPILEKRDYSELFVETNESQEIAANAYFSWWEKNKRREFNEFKSIDPLKYTVYKWH
jgi:hypothetical protein